MTFSELARSYLEKAGKRRRVPEVLLDGGSAFRPTQDVGVNADPQSGLTARLRRSAPSAALRTGFRPTVPRAVRVDPPKWHDVGPVLLQHSGAFEPEIRDLLPRLAEISRWLRKEREFAFYGDIDFILTEEYSLADAERAIADANEVYACAVRVVIERPPGVRDGDAADRRY